MALDAYRIIGIESSPYAIKVRAVMRYRRLAYRWVARMPQFYAETAAVRPLLMPVVQFPDGAYRTDSTPIIRALEARHPAQRSVIPEHEAHAFLCDLIEDMADEWLTKCLFHYRFSSERDSLSGAGWVIDDAWPDLDDAAYESARSAFIARQRARMPLVGCTPENAPVLEAFYYELLEVLEAFVATDRFLFGSRPSLADFGLYGQLHTLASDPTPAAIMRTQAPRTRHWVLRLDDASGVEGEWVADAAAQLPVVQGLSALAARYYLPFLAANRKAIDEGEPDVEVILEGRTYRQPVYRYQEKCRTYLTHRYATLSKPARDSLAMLTAGNPLERWLQEV